MRDGFRKSGPPTDGIAPGPLTPSWRSEPNADELARLLRATPGEAGFEGLEPFDFRTAPDLPLDIGKVIPIRPAIPDDLDRAFHERPSEEMDLFGAEDGPAGIREDEGGALQARRPNRWRSLTSTFALASVLLILSPFVTSYPYRKLTAAFPELSFETVAQAAANVRNAVPALTQSLQAHWPSAEWLTAWLETTSAPPPAKVPASALAVQSVMATASAPAELEQVGRPSRLELASADGFILDRSDPLRVRDNSPSLPPIPDHASGSGSDIILSAGPETLETPPASVSPDAAAPANAETAPKAPVPSDAAAAIETRPLPAEPSAALPAAPINPNDLDALLEKLSPVLTPGAPDRPTDAAALPAPRFDVPSSPDPGAELVEALARERKEALDRERERADALARELAGLRDAIDAMKARSTPPMMSAPALQPLPLPPPSGPVQAPQPAPTPVTAPIPDPVRVVPPPPPTEQVRLDPPQPAAPPPASQLPDIPAPAPRPPAPQSVVQAPANPAIAPNEQRLIERAEALLKLYDISGARLILERAMAAGSARAAYLLAQTYDPQVLDEWRVVGIKGDPGKAQELYARAQAGGVREAGQRRP